MARKWPPMPPQQAPDETEVAQAFGTITKSAAEMASDLAAGAAEGAAEVKEDLEAVAKDMRTWTAAHIIVAVLFLAGSLGLAAAIGAWSNKPDYSGYVALAVHDDLRAAYRDLSKERDGLKSTVEGNKRHLSQLTAVLDQTKRQLEAAEKRGRPDSVIDALNSGGKR
jgi:hypothetical protein